MKEVRRRVAIITGAARGIGKAAFSRLRTEGVTVVGTDILLDPEDQETQLAVSVNQLLIMQARER